jgi:hypothetical protein
MESRVESLKCKTCGGSMVAREPAGTLWCARCGKPSESRRLKAAAISAEPEDPIRDLVLRIYCRVMIVLMLYVLSTGPMYWAIFEAFNTSGSSFLAKLYYPIALACQHSDTICNWFDWYVGLWVY